jgi:HEAT repeat protein
MDNEHEVMAMSERMARQNTYDSAWMLGLEIQTFGKMGISSFTYVLEKGTIYARRAAAFWLSDEAEQVPSHIFLKMAKDEDGEIRFHAAYGLGYVKHEEAIPVLRDLMHNDPSAEVRQTATQSLFAAARLNGGVENIIDDFAGVLGKDESPTVREEVATSLANYLKSPVKHRAVTLLLKAMKDPDTLVRDQARISLSVLRDQVWDEEPASPALT